MKKYQVKIVKGLGKGEKIGFGTLNFDIPEDFDYEQGVYAGHVYLDSQVYRAGIHYGPSFIDGIERDCTLEAHLLDFDDYEFSDIYIEMKDRIRDIEKFDDVNDLKEAINKDIEYIRKLEL